MSRSRWMDVCSVCIITHKTLTYTQGGGGGCCLTKTAHVIIIATWSQEKGQTGPACHQAVEKLGDYLREKQF